MQRLAGHWQLAVILCLVFAFWQSVALVPLKLLTVFFHEASHAAATLLTGGDVLRLELSPAQGGSVLSRGGNRFVILNAGYLGSLLCGAALVLAATRSTADRVIMAGLGVLMLALAALYVRNGFTLIFLIGAGLAMLAASRFLAQGPNDLILRVIGLTSMVYVPFDIYSDTIARAGLNSDARMLAQEYGGTAQIWGVLWLVLSLVLILWTIRHLLGRSSNLTLR